MGNEAVGYAGDLDPVEVLERLKREPEAQLIDVRTRAEWESVGVPDGAAIGRPLVFLEWGVVPNFIERLGAELEARGVGRDAPLYFLCRSGNRSAAAARAATAAGFPRSYNVAEGFEGARGASEALGRPVGWKARDLPWTDF